MNRTERFYKIEQMLHEQQWVPIDVFLQELEVSRATFKRDIEYLRDRLHAPIVWDRDAGGYRFDNNAIDPSYELPGLWFSASELYALLAAQKLLADIEPGILARQVSPLQARLVALLEASGHQAGEINRRVHLLSVQSSQDFLPKLRRHCWNVNALKSMPGIGAATKSILALFHRSGWCITATTGIDVLCNDDRSYQRFFAGFCSCLTVNW